MSDERRRHESMVMLFWVAQWICKQTEPWTRKDLVDQFSVSRTTAADWSRAAVKAGMAERIYKIRRPGTIVYRSTR